MIEITRAHQFPFEAFVQLKKQASLKERDHLETLEKNWQLNIQQFQKTGEGLFLLKKNDQLMGIGSLEWSPFVPPTAGIGLLRNCYLIPSERGRSYGLLLYRHIVRYAQRHFGLLQLEDDCPMKNSNEKLIELD
ncbi:MAG: GNAT family N-acetyltransferase [Bacteroidota bacterium]